MTGQRPCSFCQKTEAEVERLAGDSSASICNECIELCNDILAGDGEVKLDEQLSEQELRNLPAMGLSTVTPHGKPPTRSEVVEALRKKAEEGTRGMHFACSFCGKTQDDVRKLIAGPSVCICDDCVGRLSALR